MIRLEHVSVFYRGRQEIVHDISMAFQPGKITGIIGKNGSGKTTLLKAVSGLIPYQGNITLQGKELTSYSSKQLAKCISMLPQTRDVPSITARTLVSHGRFPYLSYPRVLSKKDNEIVTQALKQADALSYAEQFLPNLSGGERQKVYLAMVLAQDTPIIFMDEPTTYLDLSFQFEILRRMDLLRRMGKTVVTVLHDLGQALTLCDYICLLDQGKMAAYGTGGEVYESGIIDRIFHVRSQKIEDTQGQEHFIFYPQYNE